MSPPELPANAKSATARSSAFFTAGTAVSRVSGVIRESVVGAVFGAGTVMDAFVVAYRIPNLLRELIAEGALGSSFTQVYTATAERDEASARNLLHDALRIVLWLGLAVALIGIACAPWLVALMSRRGSAPDSALFTAIAVRQTQILFPTIAIFALTSIITGALHKKGRFFVSAVSPFAFNLANIGGALLLSPLLAATCSPEFSAWLGDAAITGLSIGVLSGAGMQMWFTARGLKEALKRPVTKLIPWTPEIRKVAVLMIPMIGAASAGQVNVIVNTNFATSLEPGAVTWLNFAFRFLQLPIGMFGVAISTAVLPALTRAIARATAHSDKRVDAGVSTEITNALELVVWLLLPSFAFLYVASPGIITFFYEAGRFTARDSSATAIALQAYSLGLVSYGLLKVLNSYYYATERTRYAMWVGIASIAVNYVANDFLVTKYGHRGLALTTSATLTGNALLLMAGMTRDKLVVHWGETFRSIALLTVATFVAITMANVILSDSVILSAAKDHFFFPQFAGKKFSALLSILANGLIVGAVFAPFAMVRLRTGPSQFTARVRQFRSRRK